MSEPKAAENDNCAERPLMNKRVERKDDGRILIYYKFDEKPSPAGSAPHKLSTETAGAQ
ncbi:MAG TPA: hypothetical protein V6C89_03580 [Drouetiella sp.]|jgi:hypothetical protein